jgi:hypothetical protein
VKPLGSIYFRFKLNWLVGLLFVVVWMFTCHSNEKCIWCSDNIRRGSKMVLVNGFAVDVVGRFIQSIIPNKALLKIVDKILRFLFACAGPRGGPCAGSPCWGWSWGKYIHRDCGLAEMIRSSEFIYTIRNNSIADIVKSFQSKTVTLRS